VEVEVEAAVVALVAVAGAAAVVVDVEDVAARFWGNRAEVSSITTSSRRSTSRFTTTLMTT